LIKAKQWAWATSRTSTMFKIIYGVGIPLKYPLKIDANTNWDIIVWDEYKGPTMRLGKRVTSYVCCFVKSWVL
jgi:hypothetical protein